ncbi:cation diffusion facilitator family transporter [Kushneria indalinina]|uniref:Cation diffusion facilitator family transporter n=1 Tax=Kushneria indalinina DSM 14324 TaxID=1122140 RepID=A0A3D9DWJ4_9GAMM|nr:cation diffusion facilitator family transporter [Kushneria indalinina]REC95126.1 cation diffusion facilitator family transporter [Kushneria indalinina DSM 14324]
MSTTMKIAWASLLVGFAVLGLKTLAYALTGSVALLSDALESLVNVVTAVAALIAIRVAAMPADDNHPYGHHKAEFFSAVLEGVMIIIAALLILREAITGLMNPQPLELPLMGIVISLIATVINAVWSRVLIRVGTRERSPALVADGRHLFTDVVTSAGVIVGVVLAMSTGWWLLDPLVAIIVAVNILWSGAKVIRESLSGLMDEAVSPETMALIHRVIASTGEGAVEAHDVRTRHAGRATFIDFHLVVPGDTTVFHAHEICDRIETGLRQALGDVRITIHVEPEHKVEPIADIVFD